MSMIYLISLAFIFNLRLQFEAVVAVGPSSSVDAFDKLCLIEYRTKDLHDLTLGTELADGLWVKYTDVMEQRITLGATLNIHFCPKDLVGHLYPSNRLPQEQEVEGVSRESAATFDELCVKEFETKLLYNQNLDNQKLANNLRGKYMDLMGRRVALGARLNIHYCPKNLVEHLSANDALEQRQEPQNTAFNELCLSEYRVKYSHDQSLGSEQEDELWVKYLDLMEKRIALGVQLNMYFCPWELVGHLTPMKGDQIDFEERLLRIFNERCYRETYDEEMCRLVTSESEDKSSQSANENWCQSYEFKKSIRMQFAEKHMLNPTCRSDVVAYAKEEVSAKQLTGTKACDMSCKPKKGFRDRMKKFFGSCCAPQAHDDK